MNKVLPFCLEIGAKERGHKKGFSVEWNSKNIQSAPAALFNQRKGWQHGQTINN